MNEEHCRRSDINFLFLPFLFWDRGMTVPLYSDHSCEHTSHTVYWGSYGQKRIWGGHDWNTTGSVNHRHATRENLSSVGNKRESELHRQLGILPWRCPSAVLLWRASGWRKPKTAVPRRAFQLERSWKGSKRYSCIVRCLYAFVPKYATIASGMSVLHKKLPHPLSCHPSTSLAQATSSLFLRWRTQHLYDGNHFCLTSWWGGGRGEITGILDCSMVWNKPRQLQCRTPNQFLDISFYSNRSLGLGASQQGIMQIFQFCLEVNAARGVLENHSQHQLCKAMPPFPSETYYPRVIPTGYRLMALNFF